MHPIGEMVAMAADWRFWLKVALALIAIGAAIGGLIVWALL